MGPWLPPQRETFPKTAPHDADVTRHCPTLPARGHARCLHSEREGSERGSVDPPDSCTGSCWENPLVGCRRLIYSTRRHLDGRGDCLKHASLSHVAGRQDPSRPAVCPRRCSPGDSCPSGRLWTGSLPTSSSSCEVAWTRESSLQVRTWGRSSISLSARKRMVCLCSFHL